MSIYERLGVRPVINGAATLTRLGGSLMPPPVIEAMVEASRHFVDLHQLQQKAGERIAELTHNEAAYICSGAAAGLVLATAACITGTDPSKAESLPRPERIPNGKYEVVVHRCQRNGYDFAVRQVGVTLVEIGPPWPDLSGARTRPDELEAALGPRTAAVVYFAGAHFARNALPLEEVIRIAHARNIPVIVDAAAQLPPPENLWRFTRDMGADLAIFSGGKGLQGPQPTGLILGRRDLIEACRMHGNPNQRIGRPMKVGKEEMCGLVAAVEWYLSLDHAALMQRYEDQVAYLVRWFDGRPGIRAERTWPSEAGQPMPRACIRFDRSVLGFGRDEVLQALRQGEPAIELAAAEADGVYVNPQTLEEGQERIIADRLDEVLKELGSL